MAHPHHGVDVAAGVEIGLQLHPNRIRCRDQVVKDAIGDLLMGNRTIAIAVYVELDRFQLDHSRTGLVDQPQHREIGVSGKWTLAGEFRKVNRHLVVPPRPWVVEADQFSLGNRTLPVERSLGLLISQGIGLLSLAARLKNQAVHSVTRTTRPARFNGKMINEESLYS